MKNKLQQFIVKLLAATLAIILAVPTNVFAMKQSKSNIYTAATSVMGVQEKDTSKEETENTDSSLIKSAVSQEETTDYIIEKSATLSKTTGQVDYKIVVKTKDPSKEFTENQITTFGITENTDDEKLSVDDVKVLDADGNETDIKFDQHTPNLLNAKEDIRTTGITSAKPQYGMVYYLSTKLTEEALKNLEEKSPQLALDFTIASPNQNPVQTRYSLETTNPDTTEITIDNDNNVVNQAAELVEKEDNLHLYKGEYKKEEKTLFQTTPAHLVWTDYINAKDDKEFAIDFDLDENQDTENSQIKIDYYEASDKGYVLNQSFSKTVDFTNSLNLTIPQGYIAKLEVITKPKENTNAKEYEFNGIKIQNPSYTEETSQAGEEEKPSEDDADPLPADTSKEENSKTKEEDERQKTEESGKNAQSAIALNKDAYISDLKENNKLSTNLENATKQIVPVLESYNKEEINWDDFKASIQNIAKAENIDSAQAEEIISALLRGLNEDKYKVANVDIKEATNFDQASENALTTDEIKALIKSEFAKEKSGQITEEELEASLASIREENNITNEDFFNILRDLYKNDEIANDSKEDTTTIKTDKTKEEVLAEKLAEENLSTEDFIAFLQSYVKSYDIKEDQLESLLKENQVEVEKVIGDFTIDEIVAAAYLEGLNPHIFAADNPTVIEADFDDVDFKTELEYYTETLTRATNEQKLFDIVRKTQPGLKDHAIRNDYVGWKINIPGTDKSGNDITEFKKKKYEYEYLNFSIYAPAGQSLKDYQVVVEDGEGKAMTSYSGSMTEKKGGHYVYNFSIPKADLSEAGYNIYVVAKAPKKRQNYAIGVKISPDKNYVNELVKDFDKDFEELSQKYPFLIKWKDTSTANPYRNGINLIDTRMVYLEPNGWQDLFPYNGFRSLDYNDNIDDTDIMKNRVSMFGNIKEDGQITWTISETFPAERLVNKNTVGIDAYSAKTDGQGLTGPSVQILVPNDNGGYDVTDLGNVAKETLQEKIGNKPGTIVNYTFTDKATNKEEFTTLSLDSGKSASIAYKPSLLQREEGAEKDTTGLAYLHKVQEHKDGSGYEVALSKDQANTMKAFIPSNPNANPRYNDPAFTKTGVIVFCLNPGKPEPTRQYKFNGTITKGEWSTAKKDWVTNGKALAALATANEAKSSPLYKGQANDEFYSSLYEYLLRMYWYGQEMAEEYQLDEQSYYKIIQYNLYYWLAGENYAESFRNGGGYNPNYFSSAEYSYATGLKNRILEGKDWGKVNKDEEIQFFYYGHDKTRSYQNTITGDTKKPAKKGSVTVNKIDQDQDGKKLPGAYFQLLDKNKDPIKTLVTDENGVAVFEDLDYGTYYIKEVQGPKGYQFKEEISDAIVVGKTQAHYTFNYKNKKNEIEFKKVNEKGLAMDGVVFELRQNGRSVAEDRTSGKDGKFSWKELTPGNYQVVEKDISKYPEYSENEGRTVASFRVDENNIIQDQKIYYHNGSSQTDIVNKKNEGKPISIEFTKVDLKTDEALEGAEFVLEYRKPDSSIFRELPGSRTRSNSQGKLVWNDLVDGDYRVIETKAPDGNYDTDLNLGEKATFTIEKNQYGYYEIKNVTPSDLKITNTEKPEEPKDVFGEFEFTKVDSEDKKPLQGVEFTLTSNDPVGPKNNKFEYKVSKTTDAEGKINYTKLYPGTYTLTETKQLPGYEENTETWKVVVSKNNETRVFDDRGTDITKSNASKIEAGDGKGPIEIKVAGTTLGSIKSSIKPTTDKPNIFDLDLTITPESDPFSGRVNIYYIYDDTNNQSIQKFARSSSKVELKTGFKVNNSDDFSNQFYEIYKKIPTSLRNNQTVVVTLLSNSYEVDDTRHMRSGLNDLILDNIPVFSYFNGELNDDLKQYVYNDNIKYRENYSSNDFSEVLDYINGGKSRLEGKTIQLTAKDGMTLDNDLNSKTINGSNLVAKKENTITTKININDIEKFTDEVPSLDSLTIDRSGLSSAIPSLIFKTATGSDNTSGQGDSDGANTSSAPAVMASPITNKKKQPDSAKLTIKKIDSETKEGLEGAEFKLYTSENDAKIDNYSKGDAVTNEHGYATFNSPEIQPNTTYYVKEIAAPDGYKITSAITAVKSSATEDNKINAEIPNDKNNARFELYKKGDDGEYLEGVKFKLTNNTTNQSVELTTDGNGYISYDKLKIDTSYELEETKSTQGYTLNNAKATITVDDSGNVSVDTNDLAIAKEGENQGLVLVATNIKQPSIDFVKEDKLTGKKLYGAEFVLYKDEAEVTGSLTSSDKDKTEVTGSLTSSDKEGKFGFDNLEDGSYTVYETVSPEGYPYLEDKLEVATFTVKDGKVTVIKTNQKYGNSETQNPDLSKPFVIYNSFNEIKFKKVNEYKEALKGAKFKLDRVWDSYDDSGKLQPHRDTLLDNIETPDDGIIALTATEPGRYQLVETYAPKGYQQIKTNNKEKGEIVAEFTVERGSLDIKNVLVGNEYIQDMTGKTDPLEIVNKEVGEGKFQVNKVKKDGNTTNPLTGAKFLLKDMESGQYVKTDGTLTTNSGSALTNGNATVDYENLPVGEYELREFKSPDGYVRTINTWTIKVEKGGQTSIKLKDDLDDDVDDEITNETTSSPAILKLENKSNKIEFTKIDSKTKKRLAGVQFEIWWDQQGNIENRYEDTGDTKESQYKNYVKIKNPDGGTTFTTDADGKFKLSNLKTGHYKIYETKILDGYKVDDQPTDNEPIADAEGEFVNKFYVDMDGDIKKYDNGIVAGKDEEPITTIKNTPITGKFRVQKVGEDGVKKLDGAEFALYKVIDGQADKEKSTNQEVVKDSDDNKIPGRIEFADLEDGQYLLEETKAPDGYVMSATKWEVTVEDGRVNISSTDESSSFTRTDDTLTLNVVNKKASYPSTGGNGPKIAFAILGTATMLAAIAYYAIYQKDKNKVLP